MASYRAKIGDLKNPREKEPNREVLIHVGEDDKTRKYVGVIVMPDKFAEDFVNHVNRTIEE